MTGCPFSPCLAGEFRQELAIKYIEHNSQFPPQIEASLENTRKFIVKNEQYNPFQR